MERINTDKATFVILILATALFGYLSDLLSPTGIEISPTIRLVVTAVFWVCGLALLKKFWMSPESRWIRLGHVLLLVVLSVYSAEVFCSVLGRIGI